MITRRAASLALLLVLAAAGPGASQPRVEPGRVDACYGTSASYWVDALMDAIEDRAAFICACRTRPGPARVSVGVQILAPGRVGDGAATSASETNADEAACVTHRVHAVAHAWLASTAPRIQPAPGARASRTAPVYDHATIVCPAPGGPDTQSALSRDYERTHPHGLRRAATLPAPECRTPVSATLEVPFAW